MNVAKVLITHTYFEEYLQTATSVQMQQWFPVANAYETKNGYPEVDSQNVFKALL